MANGQITSGGGTGDVKRYILHDGTIDVTGLSVPGTMVSIKLLGEGGRLIASGTTSGNPWTKNLRVPAGTYSLVVLIKRGDEQAKNLSQEIEVVAG